MRARKHGPTLKEKIEHNFEKIKKRDLISHIGESFFEPVQEKGVVYQLRRTNVQRDNGRTLNIIDEIEAQAAQERELREIEEAKDMTFEDFKEQFLAHIEGTAANEREAVESHDEGVDVVNKSAKPGSMSKKGTEANDLNKTTSSKQLNETNESNDAVPKSRMSQLSKKSAMDNTRQSQIGSQIIDTDAKMEIPESCYLSFMKRILIEKLESKFFLAVHPFPRLEGEMIIFKPQKEDQTRGKDVIVYRDYSLRKRIETTPLAIKEQQLAMKKQNKLANKEESNEKKEREPDAFLPCLEVDITEPLTKPEWTNFLRVIDETKGLGWFQVLPVGQKSSQPYQFNLLHVLPQKNIPVEKLPLDSFIAA